MIVFVCLSTQQPGKILVSRIVGRQVGTKEVSAAFGKQLRSNRRSRCGFNDLGFVCVESLVFRAYAKLLAVGLNNLRVVDWTLLRSSRLSLTITGISSLLVGLSEPFVMYKCSTEIIGM